MRRIKIYNDITIRWTITTNGAAESLEGRNLSIILRNYISKCIINEYSVSGNTITFVYPATAQRALGEYIVELIDTTDGTRSVDMCNAFELVAHTEQQNGADDSNFVTEPVELTSDMQFGYDGKSAYEVAVRNGFSGSETEWLASLKGDKGDAFRYEDFTPEQIATLQSPATEAAAEVTRRLETLTSTEAALAEAEAQREASVHNALEDIAEASGKADAATEAANTAAALANQKATAAQTATDACNTATTNANDATAAANTATTNAVAATEAAVTAKQNADAATASATSATGLAHTAVAGATTAKQNADAAAEAANTAAEAANTAAEAANTAAEDANTAAEDAHTAVAGAIVQTTGTDTDKVMSQKAVTDAIANSLWYGIEFDTAVSSPTCTRIGNSDLHKTLPIQSSMKGCLLDDNGDVVEYLNPTDWTGNVRDGSRGQVMVELPLHYIKFETEGTKRRVRMSTLPLPGFKQVKLQYVSAYEATVDRTNNKLASVLNLTEQFRGGNNNTQYDGTYRTFIGRCATFLGRQTFRSYARKRKAGSTEWNCMTYGIRKELYWLFAVEYATLNSQAAFNAEKTSEGYRQGGLGNGVSNAIDWWNFNGLSPFVPIGHTDALGNGSGEVLYTVSNGDTVKPISQNVYVNRYRGVENPFGHVWQWTDGINIRISPTAENGGDNLSKVYVCEDPSKFNDSNYTGYHHVGNEARNAGYVKSFIFGEEGDIMPDAVGGSDSTYACDYHYTNIPTTETLRGVRFGGTANDGSNVGFAYASSSFAPSAMDASFGSRLCFIPE